ncbi:hypothetical protein OIU77_002097 [Salix suchowensis]|uniref:Uncharacterized protein n=1 Tax=Salix suchowensis TaxID=1278906 RepID=A0ABQ9B5K1_9ROSI|nr:hypothetical protein OIU77_002097 [Salix suchowensis]
MLEIMNTETLEVSLSLGSFLLHSSSIAPMDEAGYEKGHVENEVFVDTQIITILNKHGGWMGESIGFQEDTWTVISHFKAFPKLPHQEL